MSYKTRIMITVPGAVLAVVLYTAPMAMLLLPQEQALSQDNSISHTHNTEAVTIWREIALAEASLIVSIAIFWVKVWRHTPSKQEVKELISDAVSPIKESITGVEKSIDDLFKFMDDTYSKLPRMDSEIARLKEDVSTINRIRHDNINPKLADLENKISRLEVSLEVKGVRK